MQNELIPLAERLRPKTLDEFIGQKHLLGEDKPMTRFIKSGKIPSMILWGPPGVGKTTLARIIAAQLDFPFFQISAINAGVRDVRAIIEEAAEKGKAILFLDEIHRFNKSQQDSLLKAVEEGVLILIGATTENPSFEVISPLLSRCQVFVLKDLSADDLNNMLKRAIKNDEFLSKKNIELQESEALLRLSGGDARKLLNLLDMIAESSGNNMVITDELVMKFADKKIALYDKQGEQHYDIISAFIKSIRGSDPNAAVYWLARMIEGGEDPLFIARRLVILASEDIGNANPTAIVMATSCFTACNMIGYPECTLILSQTTTYLASSPKSNASYLAIQSALSKVKQTGDLQVPLAIRNAPTKLMKDLDYGKDYKYAHAHDLNFVDLEFLPEKISGTKFYDPGNNARENELREFLKKRWKEKYKY